MNQSTEELTIIFEALRPISRFSTLVQTYEQQIQHIINPVTRNHTKTQDLARILKIPGNALQSMIEHVKDYINRNQGRFDEDSDTLKLIDPPQYKIIQDIVQEQLDETHRKIQQIYQNPLSGHYIHIN